MILLDLKFFFLLLFLPFSQCSRIKKIDISLGSPNHTRSSAAINGIKNSLASGLAAACSKTILAPFDTIKTMQQHGRNDEKVLSVIDAATIVMSRPKGFFELYAGLGIAVAGALPSVGLYFGVYSYAKQKILPLLNYYIQPTTEKSEAALTTISIASAAAIGNTVASLPRVPYEVIKQKLQTGKYLSTSAAISDMFKTSGLRGFFPVGSISSQMIRDIPYAILTLLSYECIRDNWVNKREKAVWRDMVAGASAGGIGSYLTNPMDVIKTRLQVDSNLYSGSILDCTRATYNEGGLAAFLRGSVPRLMHKIPANGAFFVFYELFRRLLVVEDSSSYSKQATTRKE